MFEWLDPNNMILNLLLLVVGFVALIKGADIFVDGAAAVARKFGVPGVIIGLTVVAMGTSAPELAVSVSAGIAGSNEIAVSNVIGSNLFNLLMVLGVCALIKPLPVDNNIRKRDYPICLAATFLMLILASTKIVFGHSPNLGNIKAVSGSISRIGGAIMLLFFIIYMIY
ncbi:MAG: sodium:calcium antiporter, partial [Ruminococcus sp.]|nr:sodium:calcium antiporter [Ruminococcus sp.]